MRIAFAVALLILTGCASFAPRPGDTAWMVWRMHANVPPNNDGRTVWWEKVDNKPLDMEFCRDAVKEKTGRVVVGMLAWYPTKEEAHIFYGCLPFGYDPYERQ